MPLSLISKLYTDNKELSDYLLGKGEVTFKSQLDDNFKKVLLIAAASNLEHQVTEILINFTITASKECLPLLAFVKNKAISRQYHTFFDWKKKCANPFFSLFGKEIKKEILSDISNNDDLNKGTEAFMEIGHWRNIIMHEDYASFYLNKTTDEIFELYENSQIFITYLSSTLTESIPSDN